MSWNEKRTIFVKNWLAGLSLPRCCLWTIFCFGGISKTLSWCETRCDTLLMALLKVWTPKCWANCKKGHRHYQKSEQISPEKARVWRLGLVSKFHWNSLIFCHLSGWLTADGGFVLPTLSRGKKPPSSILPRNVFFFVSFHFLHGSNMQGGPLTSYNLGEITPITRVKSPQLPNYFRPFIGAVYNSIYNWIRGPSCSSMVPFFFSEAARVCRV